MAPSARPARRPRTADPLASSAPETLRRDIVLLLATLLVQRGDGDAAIERFNEAIALAAAAGEAKPLADAYCRLARLFRYRGDAEKAEEQYRKAVEVAKDGHVPELAGQVLYELAVTAHFKRDRDEALKRLDQAIAQFEKAGGDAEAARCLVLAGIIHRKAGAYPKATGCLEKAIERQRAVCADYELGIALGELSLLHFAQGEREDGVRILQESGALLKAAGAEGESRLLRGAADTLILQSGT